MGECIGGVECGVGVVGGLRWGRVYWWCGV